jgi:cytochrome c oxidase subunit III
VAVATTPAEPVHVERDWLAIKRAGLWLFFFSESLLFGLLLASRFFIEGINRLHLDQNVGLAITVILVTSSLTAFMAEAGMENGNKKMFLWGIGLTITLGLVFAIGVGYEWSIAEFSRQDSFGTVFFAMTGVHAAHVLSGVVMLIVLFILGAKGRYTKESHWPVSGVVMYWHFVDIVWMFFYPALYLVA